MTMRRAIVIGLAAIFAVFMALAFIAKPSGDERTVNHSSDSMLPTIGFDEQVTVDDGAYDGGEPAVGDVVAFTPPIGALTNKCGEKFELNAGCQVSLPVPQEGQAAETEFLMRVVAGPGDEIAVEAGHAVRNGETAEEPFIEPCPRQVAGCHLPTAFRVPDGYVYVLGDNRRAAKDSRYWGPLPIDAISGRADVD